MRLALAICALALPVVAAARSPDAGLRDLFFGEALFYEKQGLYFDALQRLDIEMAQYYHVDEPGLDTLHFHINQAEFSVGDFELNYRMHYRAGRAISAVLEGNVDEEVRNEAAFRLARIHFQKGQLEDALNALDRIDGRIPAGLGPDIEFLRANVLLASGEPAQAAETLRTLQNADSLNGFAAYNMGIALLEDGQHKRAFDQLDRAGQIDASDEAETSVRDKANLVLGNLLMDDEDFADAQLVLDRVSLDGAMSNQALLASGWASAATQSFDRAIVPWSILAKREDTDAAVQEARLALPYAYSQLEVYGRAALLYGEALASFDTEVRKLDASIDSIRKGKFLEALVREEIRQDEDWIIELRRLPESPETYYLMELLASHDFQTGLRNYLDLEDVRARLVSWQRNFDAYLDMVDIRRRYYEPLLPEIDQAFHELDSRIRLRREQQQLLEQRLADLLISPRPEFLATTEERELAGHLDALEASLEGAPPAQAEELRQRIMRLRGTLHYTLVTEYHERLTAFDSNLRALATDVDRMQEQYDAFVRTRQAAVHSFEGYEAPVRRLRTRVDAALSSVELLMARQGRMLERVAVDELLARRDRLDNYRDQARFALADSYDRATKERELALGAAAVVDAPQASLTEEGR